jgi:hypothetical protein
MSSAAELVHEWMRRFPANNMVSIREFYNDQCCDGCGRDVEQLDEVYTGDALGMPDYMLCSRCLRAGRFRIRAQCDYRHWSMFRMSRDEGENCTSMRDLREGWYRDASRGEDLCMHHGQRLMASSDPKHERWRRCYHHITDADLVRVSLDASNRIYRDSPCHAPTNLVGYRVAPVDLTLPHEISTDALLQVAHQWFNVGMSLEDARVAKADELFLRPPWPELVHCNRNYSRWNNYIVHDPRIGNIQEWVPFDCFDSDADEQDLFSGYALVNCNPQSRQHLQIAILVINNDGLVAVDSTGMVLSEYLRARDGYQIPSSEDPLTINFGVKCNECSTLNFTGAHWRCTKCADYDLCEVCKELCGNIGKRGKHRHRLVTIEPPERTFIETLRLQILNGMMR